MGRSRRAGTEVADPLRPKPAVRHGGRLAKSQTPAQTSRSALDAVAKLVPFGAPAGDDDLEGTEVER